MVAAIDFTGFDVVPADHLEELRKRIPLKVGEPRDRQLVVTTHEMALNELSDNGYPYGQVTTNEEPVHAETGRADIRRRSPARWRTSGRSKSPGTSRSATASSGGSSPSSPASSTGAASCRTRSGSCTDGAVPVRQHRDREPGAAADEVPIRVTVAEGKHQRVNFGVGYGTEEKRRASTANIIT